jgi:hypothetical protein
MTAAMLPVPTELQPPPNGRADGGDRRRPAPVGAILAALARMTSHAGEPETMTATRGSHAVSVVVVFPTQYAAWREMLFAAGVVVTGDPRPERGVESHAVLHGWAVTVRLVGS